MDVIFDFAHNHAAATQAVKYVMSTMDIGASNKLSNVHHFGTVQACVSESRDKMVDDLKGQGAELRRTGGNIAKAMVDTWAIWARHYGCGNCGEQSALAFVYLRDTLGAKPLDWMHSDSLAHGFVVIGRIGVTSVARPSTWNSQAVICDPWEEKVSAVPAASWLAGKPFELIYRFP